MKATLRGVYSVLFVDLSSASRLISYYSVQ